MDSKSQDPTDKAQLDQIRKELGPFRKISQDEDLFRVKWAERLYFIGCTIGGFLLVFLFATIVIDFIPRFNVLGSFTAHDYKDVKWLEVVDRIEPIVLRVCFVIASVLLFRFCFLAAERLIFQTPLFTKKNEASGDAKSDLRAVSQIIKF